MPSDPANIETGEKEPKSNGSREDKKCQECMTTNADTKFMTPYTKPTGYYCSTCCQLYVQPSDELFRRDMKQFWNKYPDPCAEDNSTF